MPDSDYDAALAWLYDRQRLGIKLGLGKVRRLLAGIDDPHTRMRCIHVAGTNGKGSVARVLHAALRAAGKRVGLFTSPHLVRFTERIAIDEEIQRADVVRIIARLRPITDELDAADEPPTFFELVTAMAFLHFAEHEVEWAVIETGMGGRLDATNVVIPEVAIITDVEMDHQAFLGDTRAAIAAEKAGIIKPHVPVVTAAGGEALEVILARSRDLDCHAAVIGQDYEVRPDATGFGLQHPRGAAHLELAVPGQAQARNGALCFAAWDALRARHDLPEAAMFTALATTQHPGRMERIESGDRHVLLDGAHNLAAAATLRHHLGQIGWSGFHLIVGFQGDKEWRDMLAQWHPLAARVTAVPLRSPRSVAPADIVAAAACPADEAVSAAVALDAARGRVVVAGSLWLVGDARAHLRGEPIEELHRVQ